MTWWAYVERVAKTTRQRDIAERVGVDPSNITRWKTGSPRAETVAAFARAYGRPVTEAFVAAGYMTSQEAKVPAEAFADPQDLGDDQLIEELRRRLNATNHVWHQAATEAAAARPQLVAAHDEDHSIESEQEVDETP